MDPHFVLKQYFGYDDFRRGQKELIDGILAGRDVLGIMPTGAGKSLCYQVPALLMPGITLVVSPLISLMMDQVKALNEAGIHAAYINSSLTEGQISRALQNASQGRYKIIYVAPERLETDRFLQFALHTEISMVTVDEAHCISQWGQDFRPSYLKIVQFIQALPARPVVSAFTATATRAVKEDIACILSLRDPVVLVTGFDRENLFFEVRRSRQKEEELYRYLQNHPGESGIVYCATRKNVEKVWEFLESNGIPAARYHAGLTAQERKQNQEDFIYDRKGVVVATNAFGMGIDKSNVRFVVHYNMPQSLENYYQEAGRAGRDGEAAECVILYSPQDVMIGEYLIENKEDNEEFTPQEMELIRERDMERLRAMNGYCNTRYCLREYILRYFGDSASVGREGCGNCSNCLAEYEEADVTDRALAVVQCIRECRQRFGLNVIVGVLRGANTAKLRAYGLTGLASYGLCRDMSEGAVKGLIQDMMLEGLLEVTRDKYALLKLKGEAWELLDGKRRMRVRVAGGTRERQLLGPEGRELYGEEPDAEGAAFAAGGPGGETESAPGAGRTLDGSSGSGRALDGTSGFGRALSGNSGFDQALGGNSGPGRASAGRRGALKGPKAPRQRPSDILNGRGLELLARLKAKRLEIAREAALPPYIVFSDKTLTDMCVKAPQNRQEMLEVTGVGAQKYDRYGERFLECIREFSGGRREKYHFED